MGQLGSHAFNDSYNSLLDREQVFICGIRQVRQVNVIPNTEQVLELPCWFEKIKVALLRLLHYLMYGTNICL